MVRCFVIFLLIVQIAPVFGQSRDHLLIVGSSTVYPFSSAVAEAFSRQANAPLPVIESTGTGGGMSRFCAGVGVEFPDLSNASRRMRASELAQCEANGVSGVLEVKIGFDGIVLASSSDGIRLDLTPSDVYLALARFVPDATGETLVANPYDSWSQVNSTLPNVPIRVLSPPPSSGTRDAYSELIMEAAAENFPVMKTLSALPSGAQLRQYLDAIGIDPTIYDVLQQRRGVAPDGADIFALLARSMRTDGHFVEAGENDDLLMRKLEVQKQAVGILGYSFLQQNAEVLNSHSLGGVSPSVETIADGSYVASRPLYIYAKADHRGLIPGVTEFLTEYTSEAAFGEGGYLIELGLVAMPLAERQQVIQDLQRFAPVSL